LDKILWCLTDSGFAIMGFPDKVLTENKVVEQFEELDSKKVLSFLSMQTIDCSGTEYHLLLIRKC